MFQVYILYSLSTNRFYKGQTSDLSSRLARHNSGFEKYTSAGRPWNLVWSVEKDNRALALALESKLKNLNRSRLIEFILKYNDGIPDSEIESQIRSIRT